MCVVRCVGWLASGRSPSGSPCERPSGADLIPAAVRAVFVGAHFLFGFRSSLLRRTASQRARRSPARLRSLPPGGATAPSQLLAVDGSRRTVIGELRALISGRGAVDEPAPPALPPSCLADCRLLGGLRLSTPRRWNTPPASRGVPSCRLSCDGRGDTPLRHDRSAAALPFSDRLRRALTETDGDDGSDCSDAQYSPAGLAGGPGCCAESARHGSPSRSVGCSEVQFDSCLTADIDFDQTMSSTARRLSALIRHVGLCDATDPVRSDGGPPCDAQKGTAVAQYDNTTDSGVMCVSRQSDIHASTTHDDARPPGHRHDDVRFSSASPGGCTNSEFDESVTQDVDRLERFAKRASDSSEKDYEQETLPYTEDIEAFLEDLENCELNIPASNDALKKDVSAAANGIFSNRESHVARVSLPAVAAIETSLPRVSSDNNHVFSFSVARVSDATTIETALIRVSPSGFSTSSVDLFCSPLSESDSLITSRHLPDASTDGQSPPSPESDPLQQEENVVSKRVRFARRSSVVRRRSSLSPKRAAVTRYASPMQSPDLFAFSQPNLYQSTPVSEIHSVHCPDTSCHTDSDADDVIPPSVAPPTRYRSVTCRTRVASPLTRDTDVDSPELFTQVTPRDTSSSTSRTASSHCSDVDSRDLFSDSSQQDYDACCRQLF